MPISWIKMEEYEEDGEFKWIEPKKVVTDDYSLWRLKTVLVEYIFSY